MILVDTSVWINLLNNRHTPTVDRTLFDTFVTTPPIVQEILQGIRDDVAAQKIKKQLSCLPLVGAPVSLDLYCEAAQLYRSARRRGYTVRSSTDCLIAAIAIHHSVPVWHQDRDFTTIARFTDLREYQP
jgi:predicted nucleic acid-binding protein